MRRLFEYCTRDNRSHAKYLLVDHVSHIDYYDNPNVLSKVYMDDGTVLELELKYVSKLRDILNDWEIRN